MKESGRSEPQSAPMRCHGRGGRYTGGEWVPITDIEDSPPRCTSSCSDCPKRRVPDGGVYDVVVVGAGVIGSAVCRELSKYTPSVLLLEAAEDVAAGATKANSGIVHSGYNSLPGTLRAKFCWPGCRSFPQLDRELNFGFERNGSMVVARSEEEDRLIRALLVRGRKNGVEGLRVVERDELRRMEPHVTPAAVSALWSPHAGIVSPYELAIALAENAADNGVEVRLRREVVRIDRSGGLFSVTANRWARPRGGSRPHAALGTAEEVLRAGGSGSRECTGGVVVGEETVRARYVINCAGGGSAEVARLIGDDSFVVRPRVGNFVVLRREQGRLANATLFPCPDPKKGKGILVQHTLWGNLMLGPTSRDIHDPKAAAQTTEEVLAELINSAKDLVPAVDAKQIIHSFSGSRSRSGTGDWVIGPSLRDPRFINVAAIDSPGLASSPAIAREVAEILRRSGLPLAPNPSFNPHRRPIPRAKRGSDGLVFTRQGEAPPAGVPPDRLVVCRCELVTEAEVVDACHRSIPVDGTQAVRRRTRAGMGQCQANHRGYGCEERVARIVARETGVHVDDVGRRPWPATSILPKQWLEPGDRRRLEELSAPSAKL